MARNMKLQKKIIFPLVFFLAIILVGQVKGDEEDISISALKYTNDLETGEEVILIGNGKDYGTIYNYKMYDDDDDQYRSNDDNGNNDDCDVQNCLPQNWYTTDFDDSDWSKGAAPFGDEEMDGINPATIWESDEGSDPGVLNDNLVIRHYFNYTKEDNILSATLKIVHNNYYVAYLNGELIRNCYYYNYHDDCYENNPEYWKTNGDNFLTYDGSSESGPNPDWLIDGENLLAILVYDHCCYQGDPNQWIDAELVINVQSWKDKPIVLGDDLALGIDFFNNEEHNVTNINVSLEIDGELFANDTINILENETYEWLVEWTPTRLGTINLTAKVFDNAFTRSVHIGYYAYSLDFSSTQQATEIDKTIEYLFNITNEGDVNDNFTFYLNQIPNDWEYSFSPNIADLEPNESIEIKLNVTVSDNAQAGDYRIFPVVFSQYYSQTIETLVHSGVSNSTVYSYGIWNNSDFPDDFYKMDYNTSGWETGAAPFGNDELRGISPNTIWLTDDKNYTHIGARHWFNYSGDLDFSELRIRIAHDDYFRVYLNDNLIRDCFSGWGCGGDGRYWEETININNSWLNEGQNVIAIAVRDNTQGWGGGDGGDGRQWLDQELEVANLRSKLWAFQEIYEELIVSVNETYEYEILVPILTKELEDSEPYEFTIWILNRGNIEDRYNVSISLNDTENFNIISYHEEMSVPYGSDGNIELIISLNENINEFKLGEFNITITSLNSTDNKVKQTNIFAKLYVPPDLVAPATYAVSPELVNSTSFEVYWYVQDWYRNNLESGNDTKYVIIQYSTDNGTDGNSWSEWEIWGNFTAEEGKTLFTNAEGNQQYRFRSIGGDDDGKVEDKEDKVDNITFVDIASPNIDITKVTSSLFDSIIENNSTNTKTIELFWNAEDNNEIIVGYDFYYKTENSTWILSRENFNQKSTVFYAESEGYYQFKIIGEDLAGNKGFDVTNIILVDTMGPNVTISNIPSFTDAENILLNIETLEDITNFTIFYKLNKEGENDANMAWQEFGDYTLDSLPIEIPVQNKYEYQFRLLAFDSVGNYGEDTANTLIDRDRPSKIRNLQISQGKTIINSTTDVLISFMSSQSQDLIEYRIYRSESVNETGLLLTEIPYGEQYLSYKDSKVEMGTTYHYSIVAVDRMNFESEQERGFLNLAVEEKVVIKEEENESNLTNIFIGLGIVGTTAAVIAFVGRKSTEEIVQVMGEIPGNIIEEKFSEIDGELLCNSCGAMFNPTETSCPSCGILKE
ncbi:MAG: hypothetical protein BEU00_03090 [Marine Group III euryarchaeote CG-Epi3]|uniref:Alpha-galactosidase NEW3 domain-containing protein n=1 Tax=Marine Group III euryarchaeote CG-Epi3 TaxID=1888997 RepID=A0A1J5TR45_9ARCH|nr:MAG: hypothetical protein BEU00_03090 [Marine Group III euryarchaeote CG-Epi3]